MIEKGILFQGEMVRQILAGNKTMTRRVIPPGRKPQYEKAGLLWVRETFRKVFACTLSTSFEIHYRASADLVGAKWKPSIFMPRVASRIDLIKTGWRRERLQEITIEDCIAEGITMPTWNPDSAERYPDPIDVFAELWDSINFDRGYGWSANPEVEVISWLKYEVKL